MPNIETVLGPIYADVQGDAGQPTALLWSSLFTDHRMWHVQIAALRSAGWRTIAIDPPGQGRSPGPDRIFEMDECTEVVLQVLNALEVTKPVVLIGISWGGMIMPRVALRAPERVDGMVLFNTTAERPTLGTRLAAGLLALMLRFPVLDATADGLVMSANMTPETRKNRPEVAADFVRTFRSYDRQRLIKTVRAVLIDRDETLEQLSGVRAPALVVSGKEDHTLPTIHSKRIVEKLRSGRHVEVPGCAHLVPVEAPDVANKLILDFISNQLSA